jgi:hypothetical protein
MIELIDQLRADGLKVTIHDAGDPETGLVNFVLAVRIDEPLDIWYVARVFKDVEVIPKCSGFLLFFPEITIDAVAYEYICA